VFPNQAYLMGAITLQAGDRVVFYTDGVTEASVPNGEEFGDGRLLRLLEESCGKSAADLQNRILNAAGEFSEGNWHDDATVMVVAVGGRNN
jgi:serine phosphatase RsbU (regulator of sigma subunit)